ncbi:MAG: sensor domain-containing diguanylate cyclase [Gammaproteobacteria bacterium]|nr:sensor domain-containing diguanylate cyclase [Gammaproteobacteria bacterium]
MKPPIPHNEEARLEALELCGVMETGPEERFDRYTRLALRMFDVPVAIISLIGRTEQVFKSSQGMEPAVVSRDVSFCAHTILGDDPMVVEDATVDPRFSDHPMVTESNGLRFYAGCPIVSNDGYNLGAICLVDTKPRQFSDADCEAFRDLASMVSGELSNLRLTTVDELTSLSNRRGFNMIATQSLQMCARNNRCASLLMVDIRGFAEINQRISSACGDKVLVEFAQMLKASFRDSDVISRLGDDKFCVLLTDSDFENSWNSVERFRHALSTHNALPGRRYNLHFSAAVVQYEPKRHENTMRMLQEAEVLMQERKRVKPLPQKTSSVV